MEEHAFGFIGVSVAILGWLWFCISANRALTYRRPVPWSSNGKTADSESANHGSNPCWGTTIQATRRKRVYHNAQVGYRKRVIMQLSSMVQGFLMRRGGPLCDKDPEDISQRTGLHIHQARRLLTQDASWFDLSELVQAAGLEFNAILTTEDLGVK